MIKNRLASVAMPVAAVLALAGQAHAQRPESSEALGVSPGELVIDPPTLINLGFEWLIQGDANRNASVAVSYRKVGMRRG